MLGLKSIGKHPHSIKRHTHRRKKSRKTKILNIFIKVKPAPICLCRSFDPKGSIVTVFDGSTDPTRPTTSRPNFIPKDNWNSLSIVSGDLHAIDTSDYTKGYKYPAPTQNKFNCPPPFCLAPRAEVLNIAALNQELTVQSVFQAAKAVEALQVQPTKRHIHIFGDEGNSRKYIGGYGVLPNRMATGISESSVYTKTLLTEHAGILKKYSHNLECIFHKFADPRAVTVAKAMSNLIDHPTLNGCRLFTGVALGINKYIPAHVDKDVTLSIVTVLKNQVCSNDDGIVAYFCFPMLGIAVPLRPGDVLIFNPNEPHGLSSRCNKSDELVCLSMYYKSSVAGLNNNKLGLTEYESKLAQEFDTKYGK